MEWVEVRGNSVDVAIEAALSELGLTSRDEATIEIMEEPTKGFLGMGSREALVRVSPKPKSEKRPRRRKRGGGEGRQEGPKEGRQQESGTERARAKASQGSRGGRDQKSRDNSGGRDRKPSSDQPENRGRTSRAESEGARARAAGGERDGRSPRQGNQQAKERTMDDTTTPEVEIDAEGQAAVVAEFLNGLLDSFGLEGDVTTSVDDDLIMADVAGEQTEALIGPKGSIMQSVGELTRTVVQRKTHRRARLRLDIGGYQERRRQALRIYTARLAEQVLADGGELMLEPMNPADRKTVHDAVVDIEGVSSFSEGEEPNRSVVISLAPGVEPTGSKNSTESGSNGDADAGTDAEDTGSGEDSGGEDSDADSSSDGSDGDGDSDASSDDSDDDGE